MGEMARPAKPPATASTTLSIRIWVNTSIVVAPTDLRMPISLTRSEMLESMILMMPIPPIKRQIPAMNMPLTRSLWMASVMSSANSSCVSNSKSSSPLCVRISTLRTCCSDGESSDTSSIFIVISDSFRSSTLPVS